MNIQNELMTKITVIVVVFNAVDVIEKTILSVEQHKESIARLIIIDGDSSDGTQQVIQNHLSDFVYYVSEPDHGIYDAMNKGWQLASDDALILFLGAGDTLEHLPNHITSDVITYGKVKLGHQVFFRESLGEKLKFSNTLHHQALLVPKRLHPNPPFNTKYTTYADFDFNQRLYKEGHVFFHDASFVSVALPDGVSASLKPMEMARICFKNFGLIAWVKSVFYSYLHLTLIRIRG